MGEHMGLTKSTPICAECKVLMRCCKNSQFVRDPVVDGWPATLWSGDVWKCPGCSCKVITGFGQKFTSEAAPHDVLGFEWSLKGSKENEGD